MIKHNNISSGTRIKEIFIELFSVFTIASLIGRIIVTVTAVIYVLIWRLPFNNEMEIILIATLVSYLPIVIAATYFDYIDISFGKKQTQLVLYYKNPSLFSAMIRNVIKYAGWEFMIIALIRGVYHQFDTIADTLIGLSLFIIFAHFIMAIFTPSKRHLGDYLAGT